MNKKSLLWSLGSLRFGFRIALSRSSGPPEAPAAASGEKVRVNLWHTIPTDTETTYGRIDAHPKP
jgi:hypothetical protein